MRQNCRRRAADKQMTVLRPLLQCRITGLCACH